MGFLVNCVCMIFCGSLSSRPLLKRALGWVLFIWMILIFHRLLFTIIYFENEYSSQWLYIFYQILYGFRFDVSTVCMLLVPLVLIYPFVFVLQKNLFGSLISFFEYLHFFWLGLINLLLFASIYNFSVNDKHLGWEFVAYFKDSVKIFKGLWIDSSVLFILFFLIVPIWMTAGHFLYLKQNRLQIEYGEPKTKFTRIQFLKFMGSLLTILIFLIIGFRGGPGISPLRTAQAMRTQSSYLNNIALNGAFTVAYSLKGSKEYKQYFDPIVNRDYTRALIDQNKKFISKKYPLLRYMPARLHSGLPKKTNIVLIILEAFSAKYLKVHGGDARIAPNLNNLINDGIYFERFMASGGRSANGLFGMFTGIPDRAGPTILRSSSINNNFGGLGELLNRKGYQTLFVHGGDLSFDNLASVLPHLGFKNLFGYREIKNNPDYNNETPWGFDDSDSFRFFGEKLQKFHQPFFATIFTVNTHHPYIISDTADRLFPENTLENKYLNSYHYTDSILGRFINDSRKQAWFGNTVFIILADHAHHRGLNYLEDRNIPLLIYAPGLIMPKKVGQLSSQLDILPTILSLSGGESLYTAIGNDLMMPRPKPSFVFYAGGSGTNLIGWIENDHLLVHSIDIKQQFLLKGRHPAEHKDYSGEFPEIAKDFLVKTKHVQQFARSLEKNNNAFPDDEELKKIMQLLKNK